MEEVRAFFIHLLVVLLPLAWAEVNVTAGHVYEVNLEIVHLLDENTTWLGIYGSVGVDSVRRPWDYFSTAFGTFTVSPPPGVKEVNVHSGKTLSIPRNPGNWYAAISTRSGVNVYDLDGTCDANVDELIEGNFCGECVPSKTFTEEENIYVNGKEVCAKVARVTEERIPVYLLSYSSLPVYLAPLRGSGGSASYVFLASVPRTTTFYIYLLRDKPGCGDYVCDPGEIEDCPTDCVEITITSDPSSAEVNVGESANFVLTVENKTDTYDVDVNIVVSAPSECTYTISPQVVHVARQSSATATLTVTPHAPGTYTIRVSAYVGDRKVDQVIITVSTAGEEEGEGAPEGEGAAPPPEENIEAVPIAGGGYWIPSLGCISNIQVVGPDRINALLEENVVVNVSVQNAGTCDENVSITVEGVPEDWIHLPQRSYTLAGGEGTVLPLRIFTKAPGVYTVRVTAMGYTGGYHEFQLLVAKERARAAEGCTHNIVVVAPEEITVVEGEDVNGIIVSNAGTCRERVSILVKKHVGDLEVVLDKKEFYLSPGERYVYNMPKLAPGEYTLFISAGNVSKESKIRVLPPPVLGEIGETFVRLRWVLILIMFLVLVGAIGYVRYRYLR